MVVGAATDKFAILALTAGLTQTVPIASRSQWYCWHGYALRFESFGHRHFLHISGLSFLFVSCLAYLVVVLPTLPFNLEAKTVYTQINVLFLSLFWECFRLAALGGVQYHIICPIISANIVLFVPTLARHAQFFDRVSNVGLALSAARNGTLTDLGSPECWLDRHRN